MQVNSANTTAMNNIHLAVNTRRIDRPTVEQGPVTGAETAKATPSARATPRAETPTAPLPLGKDGGLTVREPTLEGLREAWGTDDARYDLNKDGTVDVLDLTELLKSMIDNNPVMPETHKPTEMELTVTEPAAEGGIPGPIAGGGGDEKDPPTLEGLREAWGTDDSKYDFNADGVVDVLDLLHLLSEMEPKQVPTEQAPGEESELAVQAGGNPQEAAAAKSLTASIVDQLREAGYEKRPPADIHQIVTQLDLSASQQQRLLEELATQYPDGLGVDMVG